MSEIQQAKSNNYGIICMKNNYLPFLHLTINIFLHLLMITILGNSFFVWENIIALILLKRNRTFIQP